MCRPVAVGEMLSEVQGAADVLSAVLFHTNGVLPRVSVDQQCVWGEAWSQELLA